MAGMILKAYGKINLSLDVLGLRPDGYHDIETVFHGIEAHDRVHLAAGRREAFCLTCDHRQLPVDEGNLAYQAAMLLRRVRPDMGGLEIHIEKKLPVAAGLAGGSADAAVVLWGANRLLRLGLSGETLRALALELGSDVPFCLAPLAAVGRGRGEKLTQVPASPRLWLTLVKPAFGLSAGKVYGHYAKIKILRRPDTGALLEAMISGQRQRMYAEMVNVLEPVAFDLYPELQGLATQLRVQGSSLVILAGSGPTLIAFSDTPQEAEKLAQPWHEQGFQVLVTRTLCEEDLKERIDPSPRPCKEFVV